MERIPRLRSQDEIELNKREEQEERAAWSRMTAWRMGGCPGARSTANPWDTGSMSAWLVSHVSAVSILFLSTLSCL